MKLYLASLIVGVLVGVIYSLFDVRSPAPPLVALVGLLGILAGEQFVPIGKKMLAGEPLASAWRAAKCTQHMFGPMPGRQGNGIAAAVKESSV